MLVTISPFLAMFSKGLVPRVVEVGILWQWVYHDSNNGVYLKNSSAG